MTDYKINEVLTRENTELRATVEVLKQEHSELRAECLGLREENKILLTKND